MSTPSDTHRLRAERALAEALAGVPAEAAAGLRPHAHIPRPKSFHVPACGAADRLAVFDLPGRGPLWLVEAWADQRLWWVVPRRTLAFSRDLSRASTTLPDGLPGPQPTSPGFPNVAQALQR